MAKPKKADEKARNKVRRLAPHLLHDRQPSLALPYSNKIHGEALTRSLTPRKQIFKPLNAKREAELLAWLWRWRAGLVTADSALEAAADIAA